ncbi:MAG: hypothetical protein MUC40_09180, partial [Akkermansiaceae bacterium]|nr:hypothetical protein [Akkermansiaceae bacterium]
MPSAITATPQKKIWIRMAETWPSRAPAAILHLQARGADQDSLRMTLIWCNGQWLEPSDFRIAPTDRGLM